MTGRARADEPDAVGRGRADLDRWEAWLDELDRTALDPFEYEAMLLHREGIGEVLEIAGVEALHDRLDELDVRFQAATVEDGSSPFAPGSGRGSIDDGLRRGWWWRRLPADDEARAYATSLP